MKSFLMLIISLISALSFATMPQAKKVTSAKMTKLSVIKKNVTGELKWTGFGVGKSHSGTITLKSGIIQMKNEDLIGGEFVLDMTSLKTVDSPKLEKHLRSIDFFDVENFKDGIFKITKVETLKDAAGGAPTHKISGDLTIKGKTNPEEFLATITKQGTAFLATADAEIKDRTKYDIVYNSSQFKAASILGDKLIQDNIKIHLDLKTN